MNNLLDQIIAEMTECLPALKAELDVARRRFVEVSLRYEQFVEEHGTDVRRQYYSAMQDRAMSEEAQRCYKLVTDEIAKLDEMIKLRIRHNEYSAVTEALNVQLENARERQQFLEETVEPYSDAEAYFAEISACFAKLETLEEELKQAEKAMMHVEAKMKAWEDAIRSVGSAAEAMETKL